MHRHVDIKLSGFQQCRGNLLTQHTYEPINIYIQHTCRIWHENILLPRRGWNWPTCSCTTRKWINQWHLMINHPT